MSKLSVVASAVPAAEERCVLIELYNERTGESHFRIRSVNNPDAELHNFLGKVETHLAKVESGEVQGDDRTSTWRHIKASGFRYCKQRVIKEFMAPSEDDARRPIKQIRRAMNAANALMGYVPFDKTGLGDK
jgi:hypothetical protein